jgi:hypothetical protein
MRTLNSNVLTKVFKSGIYPNQFENELKTIIPEWLFGQVKDLVAREHAVEKQTEDFLFKFHEELLPMR